MSSPQPAIGLDIEPEEFQEGKTPDVLRKRTVPLTGPVTSPQPEVLSTLGERVPADIKMAEYVSESRDLIKDAYYDIEFDRAGLGLGGDIESYGDPRAELQHPAPDDPDAAFLQPDTDLADPSQDSGDTKSTVRNVMNFMFSDEMGLMGMKWDQKGFEWNLDNFYNQITEHPYATAFTLASYLVPIGAAWTKGTRVAGRALKLAETAGDPGAALGKGIGGSNLGFRFDNHSRLVKSLAASPTVTDGRKFFSDDLAQKLVNASPEEVHKLMPEKELRKMLVADFHQERYFELRTMAKTGDLANMPGITGARTRASWAFYKRFGNKYFKVLNDLDSKQIENINEWYERSRFGAILAGVPTNLGKESQDKLYKFMMGDVADKDLAKDLGDEMFLWADSLRTKWKELWQTQIEEGFIDDDTIKLFKDDLGVGYHLPAVKKDTPGFEDVGLWAEGVAPGRFGSLVERKRWDPAKALTGPTTKHRDRLRTKQQVVDALPGLETDPRKLTVGGFLKDNLIFQVHRGFRDIIAEGLKGNGKAAHWIMKASDYDALPASSKKLWMNLDDLDSVVPGLGNKMRKMIKKELDKTGQGGLLDSDLPVIDRELVEKFFGGSGSAYQASGAFGRFFELMTAVHKTARTALNPPTHMSNLIGNMMFLSMAGMNPFSRQALNDGKTLTRMFSRLAKEANKNPDASIDVLMTSQKLATLLGKDRFVKGPGGSRVDLAELFSDSAIREMLEAQTFEAEEGFASLTKQLNYLEQLEDSSWGHGAVKTVARAIAGVGETPGIKHSLRTMSAMYLGEDMVPKMMYVSHLARKGWGRDAILREVGRRLPQYRTVGELPKDARRIVLPWITFPAEAARIIKNNMMDNPASMMAWMQGPQIAQAMISGAGLGPDFDEYGDYIDAAPPWGVRYQSVMIDEEAAPTTLGAMGGAAVAGSVGAAVGGAKGAAVGALAGGVAGAMVGRMSPRRKELDQNDHREFARSWSLDFLPQSALFLSSFHPHEWEKINPFSEAPTPGREAAQTLKDLSPVEPFAVALPLLELYSGRGSFGREIEAKSGIQFANKAALGLLGFLSPPLLQKYGMKLEGPEGFYKPMSSIHDDNGGQMTLPKGITATVGGLALGGLTFLGGARGLGLSAGKLATATALSATTGAMAGAEVNTRRLMTDLGIMGDPRTHEKGDWTMDFLANSFFGVNKSWKVSPTQAEFNQSMRAKRFEPIRSAAVKHYMDALKQGSESSAKMALSEIYTSYLYEWGDAEKAAVKTNEWMARHSKMLAKLPQFAGLSEDWINNRLAALMAMGPEKSKIHRQQIAELLTELRARNLNKARNLKIVRD